MRRSKTYLQTVNLRQKKVLRKIVRLISKQPAERDAEEIAFSLSWLASKSKILGELEPKAATDIIKNCELERCSRNHVVIQQGEPGSKFYIILNGTVSVYVESGDDEGEEQHHGYDNDSPPQIINRSQFGKFAAKLAPGDSFGELALISEDNTRNASVLTDEDDCYFLVVPRRLYNRYVKDHQVETMESIKRFVDSYYLFKEWKPKFVHLLCMSLRREHFATGQHIIDQGSPAKCLFFINSVDELERRRKLQWGSGRSIAKRIHGYSAMENKALRQTIDICYVRDNEMLGDVELILNLPTYAFTAICSEETEVFLLDPYNFERLVTKRNPKTLADVCKKARSKLKMQRSMRQSPPEIFDAFLGAIEELVATNPTLKKLSGIVDETEEDVAEDMSDEYQAILSLYMKNKTNLVPGTEQSALCKVRMSERRKLRAENKRKQEELQLRRYQSQMKDDEDDRRNVMAKEQAATDMNKPAILTALTYSSQADNSTAQIVKELPKHPSPNQKKKSIFITQVKGTPKYHQLNPTKASPESPKRNVSFLRMKLKSIMVKRRADYSDWLTSDKTLNRLEAKVGDFCSNVAVGKRMATLPKLKRFKASNAKSGKHPKPGGKVLVKKKQCPVRKLELEGYALSTHKHTTEHMVTELPDKREKLQKAMQLLMGEN